MLTTLAAAAFAAWLYLLVLHGRFWTNGPRLARARAAASSAKPLPDVVAIVPARNESEHVEESIGSLLTQDYPGRYRVLLVDDGSDDGTADAARRRASIASDGERLEIVAASEPPAGWSGKLWAIECGLRAAAADSSPDLLLLTDADVVHHPANLGRLVAKAESESLDLVSLMVQLPRTRGISTLLIAAFVYFFRLLYPFRRTNDPGSRTAAAAGGCILLRFAALERAGGLAAIRGAIIDDCALASLVKSAGGAIWIGTTRGTYSIRRYERLRDVWEMVVRTAFDQLRYSPVLLAGTLGGMLGLFAVPVASTLAGAGIVVTALGAASWAVMTATFVPTLRLQRRPLALAALLPFAAVLYLLMTLDSAFRHWGGRGTRWRGRRLHAPD